MGLIKLVLVAQQLHLFMQAIGVLEVADDALGHNADNLSPVPVPIAIDGQPVADRGDEHPGA